MSDQHASWVEMLSHMPTTTVTINARYWLPGEMEAETQAMVAYYARRRFEQRYARQRMQKRRRDRRG